jgi:hypothetical protein
MKEDRMGRACSEYEEDEKYVNSFGLKARSEEITRKT